MKEQKWYVFIIRGYMYRTRCEPWYMSELYRHKAVDEFRKCGSKEEAISCCYKYNKKEYKKKG